MVIDAEMREGKRGRIASSAASRASYQASWAHAPQQRCSRGDVAWRCSLTLKGGKRQCHSWVREAPETDCILGVCVYSSVSHVHNVPCLPMADIYYSVAGVYSGWPGLSGHLASFIVSVLPSGLPSHMPCLSLSLFLWCLVPTLAPKFKPQRALLYTRPP